MKTGLKAVVLILIITMLAVSSNAAPIVVVNSGSVSLIADFANTSYDLVVGVGTILDVGPPTVDQLLAGDGGTDSMFVANGSLTEAVLVTLNYGTIVTSPTQLTVSGVGTPLTALTNLALTAMAQPLLFTFDLISFDINTSVGIYSLNNFETINSEVPESASLGLAGLGLLSLVALTQRRK